MRFIDECNVRVEAGDGGNGAIAWRREKFVPFGGPAGGDGGRGGDIILVGDPGLGTLYDLTQGRVIRAEAGEKGGKKDCYGRAGRDLEVRVPVGTQVYFAETGERVGELVMPHARLIVAKGGQGGRGNIHFASSTERAPRRAEPGQKGERYELVIVDPPAFARSRREIEGALRGYHELNRRALSLVAEGGVLVSASCSYNIGRGEFLDALGRASLDAGREARIFRSSGAAPDHPVLATLPESEYLKCAFVRV